jgi:hypothetical protein
VAAGLVSSFPEPILVLEDLLRGSGHDLEIPVFAAKVEPSLSESSESSEPSKKGTAIRNGSAACKTYVRQD